MTLKSNIKFTRIKGMITNLSDQYSVSPYNMTLKSNIKFTRIKGKITNLRDS